MSVQKFTSNNSIYVEFDPFGFSTKNFQMGIRLMRCESRGDLYPITANQATSPSTFSSLAPSLWHARLGHPRAPIFDSLRLNKFTVIKLVVLIFVTLVLLKNMLSYHLFLLILALLCLLILSIMIFGHLPF